MGDRPSKRLVRQAVKLCANCRPEWGFSLGSIDMYYWYFGTMLMYQVGGLEWTRWAKALVEAVVETQCTEGAVLTAKGSWDPHGVWGHEGGRVYATALMAMCLEVHTRYPRYFAK